MRYCIFHVPNHIDKQGKSGSHIRPLKMLSSFQSLGYEVDVVMGYGKERTDQIDSIKTKINEGIVYDFMYSESSTMPTLLTEKDHIPRYWNLDFNFMKFCKANGIRIGLFYRDMYWKFDVYKNSVPWMKRVITKFMYNYDLRRYNEVLDILYVPSEEFGEYFHKRRYQLQTLPPGCEFFQDRIEQRNKYFMTNLNRQDIQLFYVGGVTGVYNLSTIMAVVKKSKFCTLTICCREKEWEQAAKDYAEYLCDRITVIHKSGSELDEYYKSTDICVCYFEPSDYMDMAMSTKLFEYMSYATPIITRDHTALGNFMKELGSDFVTNGETELQLLLDRIAGNREMLLKEHQLLEENIITNSWKVRAKKVQDQLWRN